jgi:glucokinase
MGKKQVVVGIDIGGTNTIFGFIDREGVILAEGRINTAHYDSPENFVSALYDKILETHSSISSVDIAGIGIGAPMGNINKGTIEYPANLPWKGIVPLVEIFKKHTDKKVILTNDANAAAVGEMVYGGARGMKNFVVITLGTGLGSGFVIDGKLVCGNDGFAGELGHTAVSPPGTSDRECGCGKKGCLETYVSATGIKRTVMKMLGDSNLPSELRNYSFDELDSKIIHDAAKNGDKLARMAFDYTGKMLGFKLADVVAHTNPEAIFIFGGLALAKEFILIPARDYMEQNLLFIYKGKVKLLPSELSTQNAAVLGAGSLIWADIEN